MNAKGPPDHPIDAVFARLRAEGRKAFLPFLTAGDPDPAGTVALARAVAGAGASIVEIGFPYSDPIADGPVIQASYTRALERKLKLDGMFACAAEIARLPEFSGPGGPGTRIPLVAMTSFSLLHRRGPERFLEQARETGIRGAIIPDLPLEEAEPLARLAREREFKLIQLVTPTTPRERAAAIVRLSTGFVYCVSVTGITGVREVLPAELIDQLSWLRGQTELPLCVGFGISRPEQVRTLRPYVDGVIVGSALVRLLETPGQSIEERARAVGELARELSAALEEG
jgi:tryptophan synthase alpha chain